VKIAIELADNGGGECGRSECKGEKKTLKFRYVSQIYVYNSIIFESWAESLSAF